MSNIEKQETSLTDEELLKKYQSDIEPEQIEKDIQLFNNRISKNQRSKNFAHSFQDSFTI